MTQDVEIILHGLRCCAKNICDCDTCEFVDNCRDLEKDAEQLIVTLIELLKEKEERIYELEERLGIMNE